MEHLLSIQTGQVQGPKVNIAPFLPLGALRLAVRWKDNPLMVSDLTMSVQRVPWKHGMGSSQGKLRREGNT